MALLDSNRTPTAGELRWFGLIILVSLGVFGGLVGWQTGSYQISRILWSLGLGLALLYYAVRPLRRSIYALWMALIFPIGWLVSHALLAIIYYLLITPLAVAMRFFGRDQLTLKFDPSLESYWIEEDPSRDGADYFRQS